MDSLTTHPATAQQAKAFTSPASLSFPGGAHHLASPPDAKDPALVNQSQSQSQQPVQQQAQQNGTESASPGAPAQSQAVAAQPASSAGVSGIVPPCRISSPLSIWIVGWI
ncbi:TATA-box binding protein [Ascosphaera apis ARSEF 7405]|uniref:TATA-box binding protein n=1 Tax=Ascosphaera apis ARSEF 7405 TaxID=392613 RepID=A0A167UST6_9EURO|nr:TATA-box binding protein [Ascosphaera apis ARSEF 7405]